MAALVGVAELGVDGATVVGVSLVVVTTVEFLEAADNAEVVGTAAALLETTAVVVGTGAGVEAVGARLDAGGAATGADVLGTGAGVPDCAGIGAVVEDAGARTPPGVVSAVTVLGAGMAAADAETLGAAVVVRQ